MRPRRLAGTMPVVLAAVLVAGLALSSCGAGDDDTGSSNGAVNIVATTNVWGGIAEQIGGDAVDVTSIVSDPSQDPHSFEASTQTLLAVSKAEILIQNGGGYDDFMARLISSTESDATLLDAVELSGREAEAGAELNEHVWYDLPSAKKFADAVAAELAELRPEQADQFEANAAEFGKRIDAIIEKTATLKAEYDGEQIGITEPVPLYLTEAAGLVDATPAAFSEAIEEGDDVSPAVLAETLDLYSDQQVVALVYNDQTSGPLTERVREAAEQAGVAVVPVSETLPEGLDYIDWMQENVAALHDALTGA